MYACCARSSSGVFPRDKPKQDGYKTPKDRVMAEISSPSHRIANATLAGIGLMIFACFAAAANGAVVKGMFAALPIAIVLLIRSLTAIILVSPLIRPQHIRQTPHARMQFARMALSGVEVTFYFYSLAYLPIVDVMTYYLATPIYVTAISAAILGEAVGWRRWSAVLVGFAGVVIALQPSTAMFSGGAMIALAGSVLYGGLLAMTRQLRGTPEPVLLLFQLSGSFTCALILAAFTWVTPSWQEMGVVACVGAVTLLASFCTNRSLRLAPASIVVPFQYSLLPFGALFGFLFFSEMPQPTTLVGASIIVAAGAYIFLREQQLMRRSIAAADPA
jgi:drug/metabolite transporter (DMT)-like permease